MLRRIGSFLGVYDEPAIRPRADDRELLGATLRAKGGRIVEYQRVASMVLYSEVMPCLEWVASDSSRVLAGVKHALVSLVLGVWSPAGLLLEPAAALNNLAGGVEVTADFLPANDPRRAATSAAMARDLVTRGRIVSICFAAWAAALVAATVYLVQRE